MKRNKVFKSSLVLPVRRVLMFVIAILVSMHIFGLGFTPTDCGLAVKLERGDQILLSTWIDLDKDSVEDPGEEFFVCDHNFYNGGYFGYKNGRTLKLIPQADDATEASPVSIWTIDTALVRAYEKKLGGLAYTMWSSDGYTLSMKDKFRTHGALIKPKNIVAETSLADVVFVVPTIRSTSADPENTLGRAEKEGDPFDGRTGTGFLGMTYREVYWFDIPKSNAPYIYGNASLVGFNTTLSDYSYAGDQKASKGQALYSFADNKHKPTKRTLFRLYILNKPLYSCPNSYFFAYDEQDCLKYRKGPDTQVKPNTTIADSTALHKVYYMDRLECMERFENTKYYQTRFMYVPEPDSTYFYVGYRNDYRDGKSETMGSGGAHSMFRPIDSLKLEYLGMTAPKGVLGRMIIDTTSSAENLDVTFRPAGVFLRTNSGRNIEMHAEEGDTSWICNEMWTITEDYAKLRIRATLYSQPEFSETDEGVDLPGWSVEVNGTEVPVVGGESIIGVSGWARVYLNKKTANGGMEFVPANKNMYIRYDNNGLLGVSIPDQHPFKDSTKVKILDARLNAGFSFTSWNTQPDGNGTSYAPGAPFTFSDSDGDGKDSLILYAQGEFLGSVGVAISFKQGDKRYFLTHPGMAPRFATGRTFGDWTNVWQGMANAENIDPAYLSTYRLIGKKEGCAECDSVNDAVFGPIPYKEYVLDPRREIVRAHHDSVIFYENFMPSQEEYIGLYYTPRIRSLRTKHGRVCSSPLRAGRHSVVRMSIAPNSIPPTTCIA